MRKKLLNTTYRIIVPLIFIGLFFGIWQLICDFGNIQKELLPTPKETFSAFVRYTPVIMRHTNITLQEAAGGLSLGILVGVVLAVLMDAFKVCNYGFKPLIVISQTIPTIVIAPLFVIWLKDYGVQPKILVVALTTFFPIATALSDGYQSTDPDMINLMRAMGANKLKIFWFLKVPSALPNFFSGLKISATYSIIGALVSEWVGALGGLGFFILNCKQLYAYDVMFAVIFWVVALSLLLMGGLDIIKKCVIRWEKGDKK